MYGRACCAWLAPRVRRFLIAETCLAVTLPNKGTLRQRDRGFQFNLLLLPRDKWSRHGRCNKKYVLCTGNGQTDDKYVTQLTILPSESAA